MIEELDMLSKEDFQYNEYVYRTLQNANLVRRKIDPISKEDFMKNYSFEEREKWFSFGW
jgi:hypothetical protein